MPGRIRMRAQGSAGGHKGLEDVIEKLGTDGVARLRVGIGASGAQDAYEYVLDKPTAEQKELLERAIAGASEAVICWLREGIDCAMNRFNSPPADHE